MTRSRTPFVRRTARTALVAAFAGTTLALTPLAAQANAPGGTSATLPAGGVHALNHAAQTAVDTALAQLGDSYVWAGAGPDVFDCSGLTQFAYRAAGVSLPHSSRLQSTMGTPVARADLQPGDLVFFYSPVGHVGMYLGNGLMVHAPTSGEVVKVVALDVMSGYNTARRLT